MNLTFLKRSRSRSVFRWIAAIALASVAMAWVAQHRYDMQPCPWCVLQRVIYLCIAGVSLVATAAPRRQRELFDSVCASLIAVLSACGMAAALYQNLVAAKSGSCVQTLADKIVSGMGLDRLWSDMFEARASCADAAVRVFGVPFELWSLALFAALCWVAVRILRQSR